MKLNEVNLIFLYDNCLQLRNRYITHKGRFFKIHNFFESKMKTIQRIVFTVAFFLRIVPKYVYKQHHKPLHARIRKGGEKRPSRFRKYPHEWAASWMSLFLSSSSFHFFFYFSSKSERFWIACS